MQRFAGKLAYVTGAGSGIGASIAESLVAEGARVIALDLNPGCSAGSHVHPVTFDVADEAAWLSLHDRVPQGWGDPQIFINCAGILVTGDIESMDYATFQRLMAVNAGGTFLGCQFAVRRLRETALPGVIVNVVSTSALRTAPWVVGYAASKAAALSITRSVALHCAQARLPIRCNAVLPGVTMTPMVQHMIEAAPDPPAVRSMLEAQHPTGRLSTPAQVAQAVLYLASEQAADVTGVALPVDGGLTAA